jgi:ABC-type uncharacterized transport system ATPase subunit
VSSLRLEGIARTYGARPVLEGVSLGVEAGRVTALVGENGAGKSTLLKIAAGLVGPDRGEVRVDDRVLPTADPLAAQAAGIGVVHQHFMLVDTLSVADNVALGLEPRRGPLGLRIDRAAARARVVALSARHGLPVNPDALTGALSVGERQRVEILKVLYRGARVVLLDEPTAVLSPTEVHALLDTVRALAAEGVGVLLVSHKLDEVYAVADTVAVLRRGKIVREGPTATLSRAEVAAAVVGEGRTLAAPPPRARPPRADRAVGLRIEGLVAPGIHGVDLAVAPGEIVGLAGVEGNGQRDLAACVAGVATATAGRTTLDGADITAWSVAQRRGAGLGWVPEDREGRGLLPELTVAENLALGDPDLVAGTGAYDPRATRDAARALLARFQVRPADPDAPLRDLSGGNQQKVLLGRELGRPLKALVVAQPTRGVDLAARAEIHAALGEARDAGVAVLLISSDLDELRALCTRVAVLRRGRVVGEVPVEEATDTKLGAWMVDG